MSNIRNTLLLSAFLIGVASTFAQEATPALASPQSIRLNVVVAPKNGHPETGLQQSDFTLLDNGSPATISSFREVTPQQEPVKIILVIDAVNTSFDRIAYAQAQVQKFLRASEGHLPEPATLAVMTDKGLQMQKTFTSDGNALSASLDHYTAGLREVNRSSGFWGADERVQISLNAAQQLTAYASTLPGRKIVLWVSPGWPLLSGARVELSSKQQQQIFSDVVSFSQRLQRADITFYDVNPLGADENLFREDYYRAFLRGVSKPNQTDLADLSLQVLAIQSGGLTLNSNDIAGNLAKCAADTNSWYELDVPLPSTEKSSEYHHLDLKVDKPGMTVRTRDGYYAQP